MFFDIKTMRIYYRFYIGSIKAWTEWKKLATYNDTISLNINKLINEDLNNIKDEKFKVYYGIGGNTCINKPTGIDAFELICGIMTEKYVIQQIITGNKFFIRFYNNAIGTWYPWKKMLTEDDLTDIKTRLEALENK